VKALEKVPKDEHACCVCLRGFGTKDDPEDMLEQPCSPVQIKDCGYVIGSSCFETMMRAGFTGCPLCRQFVNENELLSCWLQYVFTSWYFVKTIDLLQEYLETGTTPFTATPDLHQVDEFSVLLRHAFQRKLNSRGKQLLWFSYMKILLYFTIRKLLSLATYHYRFEVASWLMGKHYLEALLLNQFNGSAPDTRLGNLLGTVFISNGALWINAMFWCFVGSHAMEKILYVTDMVQVAASWLTPGLLMAIAMGNMAMFGLILTALIYLVIHPEGRIFPV
jgi:hypothetical protein